MLFLLPDSFVPTSFRITNSEYYVSHLLEYRLFQTYNFMNSILNEIPWMLIIVY